MHPDEAEWQQEGVRSAGKTPLTAWRASRPVIWVMARLPSVRSEAILLSRAFATEWLPCRRHHVVRGSREPGRPRVSVPSRSSPWGRGPCSERTPAAARGASGREAEQTSVVLC